MNAIAETAPRLPTLEEIVAGMPSAEFEYLLAGWRAFPQKRPVPVQADGRANWRGASPEERLNLSFELTANARELLRRGICHRHPEASDIEVRRRFFELLYKKDFSRDALLGWERRMGLLETQDTP
ncbi:MAG: hypothetical protein WEB00_13500 [Dehalococcoidia bacterium]